MYRQLRPDEIWKPALVAAVVVAWCVVARYPELLVWLAAPVLFAWWSAVLTRWVRGFEDRRRHAAERDAAVAEYVRKYGRG